MTTQPRTRTRVSPATRTDDTMARASGRTVSERNTTDHAPEGRAEVVSLPSGLVARVMVRDSVTLNMGNYNSFKREIGLELDVPLTGHVVVNADGSITDDVAGLIDAAYESAQQWVSDRVSDAVNDATQFFQD